MVPDAVGSAAWLARDQPSSAAVRQASGSIAGGVAATGPVAAGAAGGATGGVYAGGGGAVAVPSAGVAPGVRVGSGGRGAAGTLAGGGSSSNLGRWKIAVTSSPCDRNQTASISRKIGASAGWAGRATTGVAGAADTTGTVGVVPATGPPGSTGVAGAAAVGVAGWAASPPGVRRGSGSIVGNATVGLPTENPPPGVNAGCVGAGGCPRGAGAMAGAAGWATAGVPNGVAGVPNGMAGAASRESPGTCQRAGVGAEVRHWSFSVAVRPAPVSGESRPIGVSGVCSIWAGWRGGVSGAGAGSRPRSDGSTTVELGNVTWATVPPSTLRRSSTRMPYRDARRLTTARPISRNAATSTVDGPASRRLSESSCSSVSPRPRSSTWIST